MYDCCNYFCDFPANMMESKDPSKMIEMSATLTLKFSLTIKRRIFFKYEFYFVQLR